MKSQPRVHPKWATHSAMGKSRRCTRAGAVQAARSLEFRLEVWKGPPSSTLPLRFCGGQEAIPVAVLLRMTLLIERDEEEDVPVEGNAKVRPGFGPQGAHIIPTGAHEDATPWQN
jgi:hypothetical protein